MAKRVLVVGAGPSGLSTLAAWQAAKAAGAQMPEIVQRISFVVLSMQHNCR